MERKIDRFDKYMIFKRLNDNKVTIQLGISVGTLGKSRKIGRDLSNGSVEKILNFYTDVNKVWLLTGEGEMIKTERASLDKAAEASTSFDKLLADKDKIITLLEEKVSLLELQIEELKKNDDIKNRLSALEKSNDSAVSSVPTSNIATAGENEK